MTTYVYDNLNVYTLSYEKINEEKKRKGKETIWISLFITELWHIEGRKTLALLCFFLFLVLN